MNTTTKQITSENKNATSSVPMENSSERSLSGGETKENGASAPLSLLVPVLRFKGFDNEWERKKMGDVGKIRMCKRIFSKDTTEIGEIPFYKIGTFGKDADAYITNELYLDYRERFSFPKIGEILMSASGTLGRTVVYDGRPSYFQDSNIVWIDNQEEVITNSFLYYIYQIVKYDSEGGTIQRLYNSIINNAKFSRPSLPEQQKIASFLSAVDEKIQQLSKKKALLEKYKKGVMQQLFSGQLRFKDKNGKDYPDWEEKKLGDVGKIKMCKRIFSHQTTEFGDIPFYKIGTFGKVANAYISKELFLEFKDKYSYPRIGEILMSASGTLGRTVIYDGSEAYFQDSNIVWIENNEGLITNDFLFYVYQVVRYQSEGGTIQRLYNSIINSAKFLKPSLAEQHKVTNLLSSIDSKIESVSNQISQTQSFKKGLLQQMFV
jgi:type I restriction enzyme S subunit